MPYRRIIFANNEIYHVVNRSIAQIPIFTCSYEYQRFLNLIDYYRFSEVSLSFSHFFRLPIREKEKYQSLANKTNSLLVDIFSYCLMPNHFHILMRQKMERGIPILLTRIQNGYAKYFNLKHKRQGSLFQSMFKAVRVETDEQLLHVSRYIHLNPSTSFLVTPNKLHLYTWSSLPEYLKGELSHFIERQTIIDLVNGKKKYYKFILDQVDYQRKLNRIKHLSLEN